MDEQAVSHLEEISASLSALVEKLDELGGVLGDIRAKLIAAPALQESLDSLQQTLNELPGELAAAIHTSAQRRGA